MILSDIEISKLANDDGMIKPFENKLVRTVDYIESLDKQWQSRKVISSIVSEINYLISSGFVSTSYVSNTKMFSITNPGKQLLKDRGY